MPYAVFTVPLWVYLRAYWGEIAQQNNPHNKQKIIRLKGNNKDEILEIYTSSFVYAQAQQNYVEIYYLNNQKELQKTILRLTLSELQKQLPRAWQIHRSFVVNLDYFQALQGNARKRMMELKYVSEALPLSQKYYPDLAKFLAKSSQKVQNHP